MTINQLRYFCAVCKYNNISQAAESLYVSQPSVSLAIRDLEAELETTLFVRNNNRLQLTEDGQFLWDLAEDLTSQFGMIADTFSERRRDSKRLTIGVYPNLISWSISFFEDIEAELCRKYPGLEVGYTEVSFFDRTMGLINHAVDVLVCDELGDDMPSFFSRKHVCSESIKAIMRADNPLAKEEFVRPEQLVPQRIIGDYFNAEDWGGWLEKFLDTPEIPPTNMFTTNNEAVKKLVMMKNAVILGRPVLNDFNMEGLAAVPVMNSRGRIELGVQMVYDSRFPLKNAAADLLELTGKKGLG